MIEHSLPRFATLVPVHALDVLFQKARFQKLVLHLTNDGVREINVWTTSIETGMFHMRGQVGTLHCTEWFHSRNGYSVLNDSGSWGPVNPRMWVYAVARPADEIIDLPPVQKSAVYWFLYYIRGQPALIPAAYPASYPALAPASSIYIIRHRSPNIKSGSISSVIS